SFSFRSDTGKWETVLRAFQSGMGRKTVLRALWSGMGGKIVLCAFGSPNSLVQNGRENESAFFLILAWKSDSALGIWDWNHKFHNIYFIRLWEFGIRIIQLWKFRIGKKIFGSGNSESEKKHSALEIQNRKKNIRLWEFRIGKETFGSGNSESEKKHSTPEIWNRKRNFASEM
ncbi:hypothetical protein C1645_816605, partial [Glomus cerebriforme]